jgi:hypothetical protein
MLGSIGNKVEQIKRVTVGPIQLGDLAVGHWRALSDAECEILSVNDMKASKNGKTGKKEKYTRRKGKEEKERAMVKKEAEAVNADMPEEEEGEGEEEEEWDMEGEDGYEIDEYDNDAMEGEEEPGEIRQHERLKQLGGRSKKFNFHDE